MELLAQYGVSHRATLAFQATDEFNNSSNGRFALIIGVLLACAIIAIVIAGLKAWERSRGRGREIRAAAQKQGFAFSEKGNRSLENLRFDVFMEATGFRASSVVSSKRPDGRRVTAFDYQLINEYELYKSPDGQTHRRRKGDPNTIGGAAVGREIDELEVFGAAATINIASFLRNVVVQPANWHVSPASRLPAEQAVVGLDPTFMSTYKVRSDDPAFAQQFMNSQLTKMLVRTGGQFGLEVRGNNLLLFANEIKPADMCDMALLAGICADLIDPELLDAYPEVVGIEADGSPRLGVRDPSANQRGPSFPEVEQPPVASGPVLPATLSGRTVPVIKSNPQIPIEEATLPTPPPAPPAPLGFPESAQKTQPTEPAQPDQPADTEQADSQPEPPQPESVDWSL